MYFACIKFASKNDFVALKIHKNSLIPSNLDTGEIGWVHAAEIKEIFNSYQQSKQYPQKNLLVRGGLFNSYT